MEKVKEDREMYDIVDSVPDVDGCNIIALHKTIDRSGNNKISLIADDGGCRIIKVDIFTDDNGNIKWDVTYPKLWLNTGAYAPVLRDIMEITSYVRGNEIRFDSDSNTWVYSKTGEPIGDVDKPCVKCGAIMKHNSPDSCLGELPGVEYACCGHGNREDSYIKFNNGVIIRGFVKEE